MLTRALVGGSSVLFSVFAALGVCRASSAQVGSVAIEEESIEVALREGFAETIVRQKIVNPTARDAEHELLFPLPKDALVSGFEMSVKGEPVPGEVLDAGAARAVYERIVRAKRDPGLLEWAGRGLIRARIFPVPAQGSVEVSFRYSEQTTAVGDFRAYAFPLRGRFRGGAAPKRWAGVISIAQSAGVEAIHSPTHAIAVARERADLARVSLEASGAELERDLALYVSQRRSELGLALLAHRRSGADGTFALFLTPPLERTEVACPKDVAFVLDVSGSMRGEKMDQARTALAACIDALRPIDRFALIAFHGAVSMLTEGLVPAGAHEIAAAKAKLAQLSAGGATDLCAALEAAFAAAPNERERSFHVLLLSDGQPTVGIKDRQDILRRLAVERAPSARCFVFGVGYDVDTLLLDRLAEETRGSRQYVRPGEDLALAVRVLSERIAEPVLRDLELEIEGAIVHDLVPRRLPDLFRAEPLVVLGRYARSGEIVVRLRARGPSGKCAFAWQQTLPECEERCPEVAAQWASRRIGFLLDEMRFVGPSQELREEVQRLGREHGLVTPFTSLLVLEEGERLAQSRGAADWHAPSMTTENDEYYLGIVNRSRRVPRGWYGGIPSGPTSGGPAGPSTPGGPQTPGTPGVAGLDISSGAAAVERSLQGKQLREGAVGERLGEGASSERVRSVGERRFLLIEGVWVEEGFREADRARVRRIEFLSAEYFELVKRDEITARIAALGARVLFKDGAEYLEIVEAAK